MTTTRALQIGLLFLLAISFAQVVWWTLDQVFFTFEIVRTAETHFAHDLEAADLLRAAGTPVEDIQKIFPHISVGVDRASIRSEAVEQLAADRFHRLHRYGWESAFFLLVLAASMAVLWRTLRQEAALRKRQQNFIAAVSHEFKSPLASLQLSAETMSMRDLGPDKRRVLVDRILDDVQRMEGMATKILSTSSLEQSRIDIHPEPISLAGTIAGAQMVLEERARKYNVDILVDVDEALMVYADPVATRMVVQNLLENAIKATVAAGGGRISVYGRRDDDRVKLDIRDTGIGFPPAESKKLFEKFYRSGDEMRRTSSGTGLGLYIVQRLMFHQKGQVRAHSEGLGRGAVFTTFWPPAAEVKA